jgi:VIT1/CCC1 family predicted Fe2+/Mn2+ transporter
LLQSRSHGDSRPAPGTAHTPPGPTVGETLFRGVSAAIAFGLGALIPLLVTFLAPVAVEAGAVLVFVAISLTITSLVTARAGGARLSRVPRARALAVGLGTLLVSYAVGSIVF